MGHLSLGMGHGALGIGHWAWGIGHGALGTCTERTPAGKQATRSLS